MVQVRDLKEQIGMSEPRPMLYCEICGSEFSANAGDYWDLRDDYVFTCCNQPMELVYKRTIYEPVE